MQLLKNMQKLDFFNKKVARHIDPKVPSYGGGGVITLGGVGGGGRNPEPGIIYLLSIFHTFS